MKRIGISPNRLANGYKISALVDQNGRIRGGNASNRDAWDLEQARPPGENRWIGPVFRQLRLRWIKGAESDVVGSRLARFQGEMSAAVTSHSDLRLRSQQRPRLTNIAVLPPKMNAVRPETLRQGHAVVHDEGDAGVGTNALQGLSEPSNFMLGAVLHSQLESGDGLNRADCLEPVREASANFLRRNEIEPTWLRPLGRRELGRIEIINQG